MRTRVKRNDDGFTIVELLVVVVVIAILAAITIVAYTGITNRAKASAASSAAEQAAKKVLVYTATNADQVPVDLATAGVTDQSGTTYQYRTDTSVSPQTFCVTATANNISYFVNNTTQTSPAAGACPGHGVNGGGTITNLALNPSFESNGNSLWQAGNANAVVSQSLSTSWANSGNYSLQLTKTSVSSAPKGIMVGIPSALNSGDVVRWSVVVRNATGSSQSFTPYGERVAPASYAGLSGGSGVAVPANSSQTIVGGVTISAGTAGPAGSFGFGVLPGSVFAIGEVYFVDSYVITVNQQLPTNAVDGSTSGWAWNGTPNNSTSTGPSL